MVGALKGRALETSTAQSKRAQRDETVMLLRAASSSIHVAVVEALLIREPRDGLQKHIDGKRLWKHSRSSELIGVR